MNKTELIERIAAGSDLSKAAAKKALDATTEAIKAALVAGVLFSFPFVLIFFSEKFTLSIL